jgi:hypothetical protein
MAYVRCPARGCHNKFASPENYAGTLQCDSCSTVVRVVVKEGRVVDAQLRKLDFEVPGDVPPDLRNILSQAVACFEAGSPAAAIVLAGLFIEGLLKTKGLSGERLVDLIKSGHDAGLISTLGFHVASASRLIRNIGAHYSAELAELTDSDARLVLEMTRKLASDIVSAGEPGTAA